MVAERKRIVHQVEKGIITELKNLPLKNITFFCVGTSSCIGDSFGPLIGDKLKRLGYKNVIGTMKKPVDAINFEERLEEIKNNMTVIAIDASLASNMKNVGSVLYRKGGLTPGRGVGKNDLSEIGDYEFMGNVSIIGDNRDQNIDNLCNVNEEFLLKMVDETVDNILNILPLKVRI